MEQYQNKNVVPNSFLNKSNLPKPNQGIDKTSTSFKIKGILGSDEFNNSL